MKAFIFLKKSEKEKNIMSCVSTFISKCLYDLDLSFFCLYIDKRLKNSFCDFS